MSKIKSTATSLSVAINPKIEDYASQYRLCVKKTAASILELANVVYSAFTKLSDSEFKSFRNAIYADKSKDSYIKKLKCIAQKTARFNDITDKLPPSYTTLYTLSQLNNAAFTQVLSDNVIKPNMTALALALYTNKKPIKNISEVMLSFKNLSDKERTLAFAEIESVCKKFNIKIKSNIQLTFASKIAKLSESSKTLIEDVEVKLQLETV
jgi:hypothetical protein